MGFTNPQTYSFPQKASLGALATKFLYLCLPQSPDLIRVLAVSLDWSTGVIIFTDNGILPFGADLFHLA